MSDAHYTYRQTEPQLWTVGFTRPDTGAWVPESDHDDRWQAGKRCQELNGVGGEDLFVYMQTEPQLWTVGYFLGDGWVPYEDHGSPLEAALQVSALNS